MSIFVTFFISFAIFQLNFIFTAGNEKIVNGIIAERENFPFQAALLLMQKNQQDLILCGGSVIAPKAILTAAHCLWNVERGIIVLGAYDLLANETEASRFLVDEKKFKVHPKFNIFYAFMDVAVVELPEAVKYNKFIKSVELPSKFLFDESFAGDIGTTAGYGRICDECGPSSVLRYTKNRIMSNEECSTFPGLFPSKTQLCVSTENKSSACRGDSGSACTIERNNMTIQVGISSFGAQKCEDGKPAIFTRLTKEIVEWIEMEVKLIE